MQPANKQFVTHAPPPLHTIATVCAMMLIFGLTFPSLESIDKAAKIETFTTPEFPNGILSTPLRLGWTRMGFAGIIFSVTAYIMTGEGGVHIVHYLPQSKLRSKPIILKGLRSQAPFTCWSWNLLGLSFFLNGLIALLVAYDRPDILHQNQWLLRFALLLFETITPITMLVAFVIRYAIWPQIVKVGGDTSELKRPHVLIQHNLNVILALIEVGLLGELPVRLSDFAVAPLYGITYVLFAWSMMHQWTGGGPENKDGPQFLYFFFDTTLGKTTTIALLLLLGVLIVFYSLFSALDHVLTHLGGGPIVHVIAVALTASTVCRFRD